MMRWLTKLTLTLLAISQLSLASALEQKASQEYRLVRWRHVSEPYCYQDASQSALRNQPERYGALFRGGLDIPHGTNRQLANIFHHLTPAQYNHHHPKLAGFFPQIELYISQMNGKNAQKTLQDIKIARTHQALTPHLFMESLLKGICTPEHEKADVQDFFEHIIVMQLYQHYLEHPDKTRNPILPENDPPFPTALNINPPEYKAYYGELEPLLTLCETFRKISPAFYFGREFGLTASVEAFTERKLIISLSPQPYQAHGYQFSPYAGLVHDFGHLRALNGFHRGFVFACIGILDQHLRHGGTWKGFQAAQLVDHVYQEQTRFLQAIRHVNEAAFRVWGHSKLYNQFTVAQFFIFHEFLGLQGVIGEYDLADIMRLSIHTIIDDNQHRDSWYQFDDPFMTSPKTGRTCQTTQEIARYFLLNYPNAILKHLSDDKKREQISGYKKMIQFLNAQIQKREEFLATQTKKTAAYAEVVSELETLKNQHLPYWEKAFFETFEKEITKVEVYTKGWQFINCHIHLRSKGFVRFYKPTLLFKTNYYNDLRKLLAVAGIHLPKMPDFKEEFNPIDRKTVFDCLRIGLESLNELLLKYHLLFKQLIHNIPSPTLPHMSMIDAFAHERMCSTHYIKSCLEKDRDPKRALKEIRPSLYQWAFRKF